MRSFFRSLEKHATHYLLISGQATVLYGAAMFSEDIDLWVEPSAPNIRSLLSALRQSGAVVHKLTPVLEPRHFRRGHGFHFRIPTREGDVYLDVMGKPPRVRTFTAAARRAVTFDTEWGAIPVAGIEDVVEMKKTRRLGDYDVISNLVRIRLESETPSRRLLRWGLQNTFRIEDARRFIERRPEARRMAEESGRNWLAKVARSKDADSALSSEILGELAVEISAMQRRDILYWSPIIRELRELRRSGLLLEEGMPV